MFTRRQFITSGIASILAVQYANMADGAAGIESDSSSQKEICVRKAIAARRTVRGYSDRMLREEQLLGVCWGAQGITDRIRGFRAVPSAGALYPLEVHVFLGERAVAGMSPGVYQYRPDLLDMLRIGKTDLRQDLARACLSQMWITQAPITIVISAIYSRTMKKYGKRGIRYADIEAGCAAQNVFLMAISQGLEAGIVGAFDSKRVRKLTGEGEEFQPLLVMPVGYRA